MYRDYPHEPAQSPEPRDDAGFAPHITVMPADRAGSSWAGVLHGPTSALEEFEGTRDAVVAWARGHHVLVRVYSPEIDDLVELD